MTNWAGFILAAGNGKRLADSGIAVPKPLAPITETVTLLDLSCDALHGAGVSRIYCVTNSLYIKAITNRLRDSRCSDVHLLERNTRSAFYTLLTIEDIPNAENFVVLNVDSTITRDDILKAMALFRSGRASILYGYTDLLPTDDSPLFIDVDHTTARVVALGSNVQMRPRFVTSGMYLFTSAVHSLLREAKQRSIATLRQFLTYALSRSTVLGYYVPNSIDVDTAADLRRAQEYYGPKHR